MNQLPRIAVTGAAGFIGRRVVARLKIGTNVTALDRVPDPGDWPEGVEYRQVDLDREMPAFKGNWILVHLAWSLDRANAAAQRESLQAFGKLLPGSQVKKERRANYKAVKAGMPLPKKNAEPKKEEKKKAAPPPAPVLHQTLYINIKNPDDHEALMQLKQACKMHPGVIEVVLVLGTEKKSAIRLPFKVEDNQALLGSLVKSLGEDAVVLK